MQTTREKPNNNRKTVGGITHAQMYTYVLTYEWNILYPIKLAFKDFSLKIFISEWVNMDSITGSETSTKVQSHK